MARSAQPRTRPAFPVVRVASGPAFEVVAELAAFASGPARASLESGKTWIREIRSLAGPELIGRTERFAFPLYAELASIAIETGPPYEPAALLDRMRTMPAEALRMRLLGAESPPNRSMVSAGAFERALAGDAAARTELRARLGLDAPGRRSLDRLLETDPATLQADIADTVAAWVERVFPAFAARSLGLIERDVQAKIRLFGDLPAPDALRIATNGVDLDPSDWATEIVVVPTVALRPFIAPVESGSRLVLVCSVADEAFDIDPAAPPRRLVMAAAALGDPLRLRILHELATGDATATELADRLVIDRTSLHHHLGILRSAGLIAVSAVGVQSWRYALRAEGVTGTSAALTSYLKHPSG